MKIWLDDIRPAPEGYVWCKSVNIAKRTIESAEEPIVLIDCDHDLGDYAYDGGDGIKLLDWLVENVVGRIPSIEEVTEEAASAMNPIII